MKAYRPHPVDHPTADRPRRVEAIDATRNIIRLWPSASYPSCTVVRVTAGTVMRDTTGEGSRLSPWSPAALSWFRRRRILVTGK
jgi:hypothetical protein